MRKLLRRQEGSSLVETAFAMLVLLPILFGTIEFSLVFYVYHNVTDAARVAARWAAVRGADSCTYTPNLTSCEVDSTGVQDFVRSLGYPGLVASNINVSTTWCQASATTPTTWSTCGSSHNSRGDIVRVQVSYTYPIYVIYWRPASFNLSSTASMVVTQ